MSALVILAWLCAGLQLAFAALEIGRWNLATVQRLAPSWFEDPALAANAADHVRFTKSLATNIGAYNAMVGADLAWTALTGVPALARYFAAFHLVAAAVASLTGVPRATYLQGAMGIGLLIAAGIG